MQAKNANSDPVMPMQTADVFGQKIRYHDMGSGAVLILLHGLANNAYVTWGPLMSKLAETHRVIAMDQIGFGASEKPNINYRIQTYVDFLGEFLRLKEIRKFTLIGASIGGWIAALYAIQALPGGLNSKQSSLPPPQKLVLCNAAGVSQGVVPVLCDKLLPASLEEQREALQQLIYDHTLINEEAVRAGFIFRLSANDGFAVRALIDVFTKGSEWIDDNLHLITIPTLVVWGLHDQVIPLANGEYFARQIPQAELVTIEKCGHIPMVEKPVELLSAITRFLYAQES